MSCSLWNCSRICYLSLLKDKDHGHMRFIYLNGKTCPPIPFYVYEHVTLTLYTVCGDWGLLGSCVSYSDRMSGVLYTSVFDAIELQ